MVRSQIVDVSLRDGLMYRPQVARGVKRELIVRLISCGLRTFEVVRFPLDGKYPQFADSVELLSDLRDLRSANCRLAVFAMGCDGVREASRHQELFDELHIPCFVSDAYAKYAFGDWDWSSSLRFIESTLSLYIGTGVEVTVGLGTSFGCPIRRGHSLVTMLDRLEDLVGLGVNTVMLGDTAGTATPALVKETIHAMSGKKRPRRVRVHFHNTFGKALLNSYTALMEGVEGIDSSLLGLGGEPHPYFSEPTMVDNGNCATEEIFEFIGREEEIPAADMGKIYETARWFASHLGSEAFHRSAFAELVQCGREVMTGKG